MATELLSRIRREEEGAKEADNGDLVCVMIRKYDYAAYLFPLEPTLKMVSYLAWY